MLYRSLCGEDDIRMELRSLEAVLPKFLYVGRDSQATEKFGRCYTREDRPRFAGDRDIRELLYRSL